MINHLASIWEFAKFRLRYPSVPFVQPLKRVGTFFSQDGQDLFVASLLVPLLDDGRIATRVVVDVGANDPRHYSNSYFFERFLGCKTIAVDPLQEFQERWESSRRDAKFHNVALGEKEGSLNLNVPSGYDNMFSSLDGAVRKGVVASIPHDARLVKVVTLTSLLKDAEVTDVLFMSIDVEGFEMDVLRGTDFSVLTFRAVLIENNSDGYFGSEAVRRYMIDKGYVYFARIGWLDDLFLHKSTFELLVPRSA